MFIKEYWNRVKVVSSEMQTSAMKEVKSYAFVTTKKDAVMPFKDFIIKCSRMFRLGTY